MPVRRWVFTDPHTLETYTVPLNPRAMTSPHRERNVTVLGTTAIDGRDLLWESKAPPKQWEFSGAILNQDHHDALYDWVHNHVQRIVITDHYGRDIECLLEVFDVVPRRSVGKPWRHEYTIRGKVFNVGPPDA